MQRLRRSKKPWSRSLSADRKISPDHLVRPRQHIGRNRKVNLLGSFEIDDELELLRLLDGNVGGFSSFEDLIYISGGPAVQVGKAHAVAHKTPGLHKFCAPVYRWQSIFCRQFCKLFWM